MLTMPYLPKLERLTLDFAFVDDALLNAVATSCRALQHLALRSTGTKVCLHCLSEALQTLTSRVTSRRPRMMGSLRLSESATSCALST